MTYLAKCIQEHSCVEISVVISRPWRRIPLHVREHEVLILLGSTVKPKKLFIFCDFPRNLRNLCYLMFVPDVPSWVLALCGPNMGTTSLGSMKVWPSLVQNLEPLPIYLGSASYLIHKLSYQRVRLEAVILCTFCLLSENAKQRSAGLPD